MSETDPTTGTEHGVAIPEGDAPAREPASMPDVETAFEEDHRLPLVYLNIALKAD